MAGGDQDWHRPLHGNRHQFGLVDGVVLACEIDRLAAEEALEDSQRFGQAVDPNSARIEAQPEHGIVRGGSWAAGADAELQPTLRQKVECGGLLGQHRRMAIVIGDDVRPQTQ